MRLSSAPLSWNQAEIFTLETDKDKNGQATTVSEPAVRTILAMPHRPCCLEATPLDPVVLGPTLTRLQWSHLPLAGGSNYRCDSNLDPAVFSNQ